METLRVVKRSGKSTFIGIDAAIPLEYTTQERRRDGLPLLPERVQAHVHRHEAPRRHDEPLHRRLLVREGHRRVARRRCSRSSPSGRRSPRSSRTASTTSRRSAFMHFYDTSPMPEDGSPMARRRGPEGLSRHPSRRTSRAPSAARPRKRGTRVASVRIGMPRVLNMYSTGALLPDVLRGHRHHEAERRLQRRDDRGDVGRGRKVRLDRPLLPVEGGAGARPQPAVSPPRARGEEAAQVHLLPDPDAREQLRRPTRWTTRAAPSWPARRTS